MQPEYKTDGWMNLKLTPNSCWLATGKIRNTMTRVFCLRHTAKRLNTPPTGPCVTLWRILHQEVWDWLLKLPTHLKKRESKPARWKIVPFSSIRDHFLWKSGNIYTLQQISRTGGLTRNFIFMNHHGINSCLHIWRNGSMIYPIASNSCLSHGNS